ncbi:hypothetical protein [Tamaricihabitans halophyticus]|nr:hypothetical protein [Tamaricihabitans halophyticus]
MVSATVVLPTSITLAQQPGGGDNGGRGADFGKSSPVGFLLLLLFLIAVVFLVRSMTKHLRKLPVSFEDQPRADGRSAKRRAQGDTPTAAAPDSAASATQPAPDNLANLKEREHAQSPQDP